MEKKLITLSTKKWRQGDMIIRQIPEDSVRFSEEKKDIGHILVKGQNNHEVTGGEIYKIDNLQFLKVEEKATIYHTAPDMPHAPISLEKGIYLITQKQEVDMLTDMIKVVED